MTEQWQELKETIIKMRDNDGTCTQQEMCKFLANLMGVLEKQMNMAVDDLSSSEKPNNCKDAIERTMGNSERKPCFIKEFGECTGTYCDECIRDTYHIRKASYDKGYADCIEELEEDAISRKSIKQKLQEHHDFFVNAYGGFSNLPQNAKSRVDEITNCIAMVVNAPSVLPKLKEMGRWIKVDDEEPIAYDCSECGTMMSRKYRFCPNCGTEMGEIEE